MNNWGVIYEYCPAHASDACEVAACQKVVVVAPEIPAGKSRFAKALNHIYSIDVRRVLGFALLAFGVGGLLGPQIPALRMETNQVFRLFKTQNLELRTQNLPQAVPVVFEPLLAPDGTQITPVSEDFSVIIPKIGINAPVTAGVDVSGPNGYLNALTTSVAHASTSFLPDEDGTVYLFSHSTNYDWFVKDLNAVFYLVKNLENGDTVVLVYQGKRYTYKITDKRVVSPKSTSYLYPYVGRKNLILQTCWPPGSTTERLLIFADLIEEEGQAI